MLPLALAFNSVAATACWCGVSAGAGPVLIVAGSGLTFAALCNVASLAMRGGS